MIRRCNLPVLILAAMPFACAVSPYTEGPSLGENPSLLPLSFEAEISNGQFFVGPEDVVKVNFHIHTDLSRDYRVRTDGSILMPLVGRLQATGSSREQLEDRILEAYSAFIVNPLATVDVEYSPSRKVTVLGEVERTSVLPLTSPRTTVLDVIASSGGISAEGDRTGVLIARRVDGIMTIRHYDMNALFTPDDPNMRTEIPYVQAGDVIYVLRTWESIYSAKLDVISDTMRALTFAERVILNGPRTTEALQGDLGENG
ncbi:MAG: polysaccharide biosynthesis/export family protein [Planctomycetota bacterium]